MIELSTGIAPVAGKLPVPTAKSAGVGVPLELAKADFTLTLAGFLDATAAGADTAAPPGLPTKRQAVAGSGKDLPDDGADPEKENDASALLWLPIALPVAPAVTATIGGGPAAPALTMTPAITTLPALATPAAPAPTATVEFQTVSMPLAQTTATDQRPASRQVRAALQPLPMMPAIALAPTLMSRLAVTTDASAVPTPLASPLSATAAMPAPAHAKPVMPSASTTPTTPQPLSPPPIVAAANVSGPIQTTPPILAPSTPPVGKPAPVAQTDATVRTEATIAQQTAAPQEIAHPSTPTDATPVQIAAQQPREGTTIQPARVAFAAAIVAAARPDTRATDKEPSDQPTPAALTAAQLDTIHKPVVQAAGDTADAGLDLRHDRGLQGMIDRIEGLRDAADANDTRIRLIPAALGAVDVAVRKDGDTLHVHFTAENPASAQLLSDAQPRLSELAEARGVKLGQTSVDSGSAGGGRQPPPAPTPAAFFAAPPSALSREDTDTDHRIA